MSAASSCPTPLETFIRPMLKLPAWGVKRGYGSFLTFEFGQPTLKVDERHSPENGLRRTACVLGQWHLWINCCHWRVLQGGKLLAESEDVSQAIDRATATLDAQKLIALSVAPGHGRSTFTFDLGGSLETLPYGDDPTDEQWTISTDIQTFSYRADGHYALGRSETPPDLERYSPLS